MSNTNPEQSPATGIEVQNPRLSASLRKEVDTFWNELPDRFKRFDTEEKRLRKILRMFNSEVAFIDKVYSAVTRLATDHKGPITILFDVDDTLVKNKYNSDNSCTTYVRPGISALLSMLDDSLGDRRYDIGLLTSRGQSHLEAELLSPTYLEKIAGRINPDFVISSREDSPIYGHEALEAVPTYSSTSMESLALAAMYYIINPELAKAIRAKDSETIAATVDRKHWYDSKLAILDYLAQQDPNHGFVFVDDLPYPASIDTAHPQVRGVALGGEASFYI